MSRKNNLANFLTRPAHEVAPDLLGCIIERRVGVRVLRGKIVETEAYDQTDAASHSYGGETPRTQVMFGPPGYLYIYFTYGMHYCCNIVVGEIGNGAAVLIRAIEPLKGIDFMKQRRGRAGVELTNGPAKLCQALAINKEQNGVDLSDGEVRLVINKSGAPAETVTTTRIGISRNVDMPWRFYIKDSPFVSR
ncbi:MAG: hypothetical protein UY35_C0013G0017 [Candidatus Saccharibacteria bacterium GW2011_GWC2_48_9]|nr:MAG: hypothetical protein UY35_C0013G0017 [Candidatus Saccharibacteria bacterium GW2011_GWC2_48_9]HCH34543.1 DNA-3-methyladenine glycosylase [Candidatus Saccharibacteria bacterium]